MIYLARDFDSIHQYINICTNKIKVIQINSYQYILNFMHSLNQKFSFVQRCKPSHDK